MDLVSTQKNRAWLPIPRNVSSSMMMRALLKFAGASKKE
jgi:hypothetical protein